MASSFFMTLKFKTMKVLSKIFPFILLVLGVVACDKYLEEEQVATVSYQYYDSEKGLEDLINAAYSELRWKVNGEQSFSIYEYGTDEYTQAADGSNKHYDSYGAALNSQDQGGFLHGIWQTYYRGINSCNVGIERIPALTGGSAALKDEAGKKIRIAELRFLRAYYYFALVQQFGAIPMPLTATVGVQLEFPRTPVAQVYNTIISDLRFAADNLPVSQSQYGRATKGAAQHYLAKVYLTRGSAVSSQRGQKPTDLDSAAYYADLVINSGTYKLQANYSDLWNLSNQNNSEVIFAIQFNSNLLLLNGSGNRTHLYFIMVYDTKPGMQRDVLNGRPFRRMKPTDYTLDLYDRLADSRLNKSFKWAFLSNRADNITKWTAANAPSPSLVGQPKHKIGDTAIFVSLKKNVSATDIDKKPYTWYPRNRHTLQEFPTLIKHLDPNKADVITEFGTRDHFLARLAETYLIAAEAYGRKGDYATAAARLNVVRTRAAYKANEAKPHTFWTEDGGTPNDLSSTESKMMLAADYWDNNVALEQYPPSATDKKSRFIHFMLNERTRELLGEFHRWEDLARTETLAERAKLYNPASTGVQAFHMLRPIPLAHIDRLFKDGAPLTKEARAAEQNPGYN